MKKLSYLVMGMLVFGLNSCSDDDPNVTILPNENITIAPVMDAPTPTDYVVVETTNEVVGNETETAGTFSWSAADSDYNGLISYYVQIAPAGSNFVDGVRLFQQPVTTTSVNFTYADLNSAMNRIHRALINGGDDTGIAFGQAVEVDVRIMAVTALSENTGYSSVHTITVNAYEVIIADDPQLFLVGAVQSYYGLNSWDNATALQMRYIGDGTTQLFEAYVKVAAADGFKFIGAQGTWDSGNYGTNGGAQDGTLLNDGGSGDVKVAETDGDGFYYIRVDIDAMTYQKVKMDWGVIGAATPGGWDSETPMTYNFAANTFEYNSTLVDGEMKFRSANSSQAIFGSGESWKFNIGNSDPLQAWDTNAPNFAVTGGSHTISLAIAFDGIVTVTGL